MVSVADEVRLQHSQGSKSHKKNRSKEPSPEEATPADARNRKKGKGKKCHASCLGEESLARRRSHAHAEERTRSRSYKGHALIFAYRAGVFEKLWVQLQDPGFPVSSAGNVNTTREQEGRWE